MDTEYDRRKGVYVNNQNCRQPRMKLTNKVLNVRYIDDVYDPKALNSVINVIPNLLNKLIQVKSIKMLDKNSQIILNSDILLLLAYKNVSYKISQTKYHDRIDIPNTDNTKKSKTKSKTERSKCCIIVFYEAIKTKVFLGNVCIPAYNNRLIYIPCSSKIENFNVFNYDKTPATYLYVFLYLRF